MLIIIKLSSLSQKSKDKSKGGIFWRKKSSFSDFSDSSTSVKGDPGVGEEGIIDGVEGEVFEHVDGVPRSRQFIRDKG